MSYAFAFLLILVPLVIFHELGHFIMAKLGGIRVTKFAFGFGKRLFGFHYKGTEYRWNLIPLGGYVDFMGETVYTQEIPDDAQHFYNRPKWIRFLVLVMGPVFNLILALGILWFFYGARPNRTPIFHGEPYTVGYVAPESAVAKAGLQVGDRIVALNGEPVQSVSQVQEFIFLNPKKTVNVEIERSGERLNLIYDIPADEVEGLGVMNFSPAVRYMIVDVLADKPAARAGFQAGDVILAINGVPVSPYNTDDNKINKLLSEAAPNASTFTLERTGQVIDLSVTPQKVTDGWLAGFSYGLESIAHDLGWREAFFKAWDRFIQDSTLIYRGIKKLIIGDLPIKTLSGPIGLGKIAKQSLDYGFWSFLLLMAILSLNLGIMNLLPIPVLDGGEIFVLLVEWISRKDFNLITKMRIKIVGFFFLVGLMGMVIITDVLKIYNAM